MSAKAVTGLGDTDGDGYDDVAVSIAGSAYTYDSTYIFDGGASMNSSYSHRYRGSLSVDIDASVAGADVNGDGNGDLVSGTSGGVDGVDYAWHGGPAGRPASASATIESPGPFLHDADVAGDCDDENPAVNPGMAETIGDGVDQNCDGSDGLDAAACGCATGGAFGPTLGLLAGVAALARRRRTPRCP